MQSLFGVLVAAGCIVVGGLLILVVLKVCINTSMLSCVARRKPSLAWIFDAGHQGDDRHWARSPEPRSDGRQWYGMSRLDARGHEEETVGGEPAAELQLPPPAIPNNRARYTL